MWVRVPLSVLKENMERELRELYQLAQKRWTGSVGPWVVSVLYYEALKQPYDDSPARGMLRALAEGSKNGNN